MSHHNLPRPQVAALHAPAVSVTVLFGLNEVAQYGCRALVRHAGFAHVITLLLKGNIHGSPLTVLHPLTK